MLKNLKVAVPAILFLAAIVAANYVTTKYGRVPVGFGLAATAGTYFAGLTFVLRDSLQDLAGKRAVLGLIASGAMLSYLLAVTVFAADPAFLPPGVTAVSIAVASATAFAASELADLSVYTPLRRRGYLRAALASNAVGAVVDTFIFLAVAGFPVASAWKGQIVGKLVVTAGVAALVLACRRVSSHRAVTA